MHAYILYLKSGKFDYGLSVAVHDTLRSSLCVEHVSSSLACYASITVSTVRIAVAYIVV
jgi:hypothetical protein